MPGRTYNRLGPRDPEQAQAHYERLSDEERVALLVARDASIRLLSELHKEAVGLGVRDALTGVLNRRGLQDQYDRSSPRYYRQGPNSKPDLLLLVDIDDFKGINDTRGHAEGDRSLQKVAGLISATVRTGDAVGRLGGDEFVAFLYGATLEEGAEAATRVATNGRILRDQEATSTRPVTIPTLSIGLAEIDYSLPFDKAIEATDGAMYTAKQGGKDQFHVLQ